MSAQLVLSVVLSVTSVVMVLSGTAPALAAETVPVAGYLSRIDAARALAVEGRASPSPERMRRVRDRLGLPLTVTMADGQRIEVAPDEVLERLGGGRAADFGAAADRLERLAAAASRVPAAPAVGGERIPGALRSAYRGVTASYGIAQRIGNWLMFQLARIWRFLTQAPGQSSLLWTLARLLAVAVAVALVVSVAVRLLRQVGIVSGSSRATPGAERERTDWARAADEALARGEAREAVRALYRLLVEILTERALVPDLPSLTPAECRIAVRRRWAQHPASPSPSTSSASSAPPASSMSAASLPPPASPSSPPWGPAVETETGSRMDALADLVQAIDRATSAFERVVYGRAAASAEDVETLREAERAARAVQAVRAA